MSSRSKPLRMVFSRSISHQSMLTLKYSVGAMTTPKLFCFDSSGSSAALPPIRMSGWICTSQPATCEIGRAHVLTPVTNAHLVCRLLLEKKKTTHTLYIISHTDSLITLKTLKHI